MFLSIISDYDLETGLCELVHNAIDPLMVDLDLNPQINCRSDF